MNSAILILLASLCNCVCLGVGLAVGAVIVCANQNRGKHVSDKPVKIFGKQAKEHSAKEKRMQEAVQTMMHNIDVYDGTDAGQRDVIL